MSDLTLHSRDRVACVVGGTGLIGSRLLRVLRRHPRYGRVVCVGRTDPQVPGVEWVSTVGVVGGTDTSAESLSTRIETLVPSGHDFYSCLGTTRRDAGSAEAFEFVDYTLNLAYAKTAFAKGYSQYALVSSLGADPSSIFLYPRTKGKLELAVKALPFWATHIVQPSLLLGDRDRPRMGERIAAPMMRLAKPLLARVNPAGSPIDAEQVANALVAAVATANRPGITTYTYRRIVELSGSLTKQLS